MTAVIVNFKRDCLTYSSGADKPGALSYSDFTKVVDLTWMSGRGTHRLAFLRLLPHIFSPWHSSAMASLLWGILDMLLFYFPFTFTLTLKTTLHSTVKIIPVLVRIVGYQGCLMRRHKTTYLVFVAKLLEPAVQCNCWIIKLDWLNNALHGMASLNI